MIFIFLATDYTGCHRFINFANDLAIILQAGKKPCSIRASVRALFFGLADLAGGRFAKFLSKALCLKVGGGGVLPENCAS